MSFEGRMPIVGAEVMLQNLKLCHQLEIALRALERISRYNPQGRDPMKAYFQDCIRIANEALKAIESYTLPSAAP